MINVVSAYAREDDKTSSWSGTEAVTIDLMDVHQGDGVSQFRGHLTVAAAKKLQQELATAIAVLEERQAEREIGP